MPEEAGVNVVYGGFTFEVRNVCIGDCMSDEDKHHHHRHHHHHSDRHYSRSYYRVSSWFGALSNSSSKTLTVVVVIVAILIILFVFSLMFPAGKISDLRHDNVDNNNSMQLK